MNRFRNRRQAGRILAERLRTYAGRPGLIVLALPRGGVPVGYEVATALDAPLDVVIVRKIGIPWNEEFAIGAIASGGVCLLDRKAISDFEVDDQLLQIKIELERRELERRERLYRDDRPFPDLAGATVILVDDGLATGSTARTAVEALRIHRPLAVIVAAPVGSRDACAMIREAADDCVCATTPEPLYGVGMWYEDFSQNIGPRSPDAVAGSRRPRDDVKRDLTVQCTRRSERNRAIATRLQHAGFDTYAARSQRRHARDTLGAT